MSKQEAASSLGPVLDETASVRSLYVGMTRGSESNSPYVVCAEDERPHDASTRVLGRDRADLGVIRQQRAIEGQIEEVVARRELEIDPVRRRGLRRERGLQRGLDIGL